MIDIGIGAEQEEQSLLNGYALEYGASHQFSFADTLRHPVAALVFSTTTTTDYSIINGRVIVRKGQFATIDLGEVLMRHKLLSHQLAEAAR